MLLARAAVRSGVMPEDRALAADEREEIESNLQHAYLLAGLEEEAPLPPSVVVRAINELVRELMAQHPEQEDAVEFSVALGCLLGEQWRSEFGWEWRVVSFGEDEGYGMVPADRRFVYFPLQDIYHLLVREGDELNLMLLFNMVAGGSLPLASDRQYVSLG